MKSSSTPSLQTYTQIEVLKVSVLSSKALALRMSCSLRNLVRSFNWGGGLLMY